MSTLVKSMGKNSVSNAYCCQGNFCLTMTPTLSVQRLFPWQPLFYYDTYITRELFPWQPLSYNDNQVTCRTVFFWQPLSNTDTYTTRAHCFFGNLYHTRTLSSPHQRERTQRAVNSTTNSWPRNRLGNNSLLPFSPRPLLSQTCN